MTLGGWIIMLLSVGGVVCLFAWCMAKVLGASDETTEHLHGFDKDDKK